MVDSSPSETAEASVVPARFDTGQPDYIVSAIPRHRSSCGICSNRTAMCLPCRVQWSGTGALALALRSNDGKRVFVECHGIRAIIPMLGSVSIRRARAPSHTG